MGTQRRRAEIIAHCSYVTVERRRNRAQHYEVGAATAGACKEGRSHELLDAFIPDWMEGEARDSSVTGRIDLSTLAPDARACSAIAHIPVCR